MLKNTPVDSEIIIFEEFKDWYKIRTDNGIIGYIEKEYLKINYGKKAVEVPRDIKEEMEMKKGKINLTWDYTYRKMNSIENIDYIDGINILSPTWFSIEDNNGSIYDKGNFDYVKEYQALGYEIWPLIDNGFDPDLTHELLSSSISRENLINNIANIFREYNVDGINIDFENVYLKIGIY